MRPWTVGVMASEPSSTPSLSRSDPSVRVPVPDIARGYTYPDGVTVGEVVQTTSDARLPRQSNPDACGQGTMGITYTFGSQACEIRIEKKTGKILIDHFASCFDVGRVINPKQIRGWKPC